MNFKTFEYSRVILFTTVARPEGQIFLPAAAAQLAARYSFHVRSKKALAYLDEIAPFLTACQESYGNRNFIFDFGAISFAIDPSKHPGAKPIAFTLARRVNVPFEQF